ncbi:MAG: hypothetical protein ACLKAK_08160 [Alkaliphilus sp.]
MKKKIANRIKTTNNKKGAALITVIMVLAALAVLATVVVSMAYVEAMQAKSQVESTKASFIAKSGAEVAATVISQDFDNYVDNPPPAQNAIDLDNGRFDIVLSVIRPPEVPEDTIIIKSTGFSSESSEIVFLELTHDAGGTSIKRWHRTNPFP